VRPSASTGVSNYLIAADRVAGTTVFSVDGDGDVRATSYNFPTPKTYVWSVPGEGFHVGTSGLDYSISGGIGGATITTSSTSLKSFYVAVHLPQGAIINLFRALVDDNVSADLTCNFSYLFIGSSGYSSPISAIVSSGAVAGTRSFEDTLTHTVDNYNNGYFIRCFVATSPYDWSGLRIRGAVVQYTVAAL
jgi:hypothetical protein